MIFKNVGSTVALTQKRNDDANLKPVTLRFPPDELSLYDAVCKAMGLTRQNFMLGLVRSAFKTALSDFAAGYLSEQPSESLQSLLHRHVESAEVHHLLDECLREVAQSWTDELLEESRRHHEMLHQGIDPADFVGVPSKFWSDETLNDAS